MKRLFVFVTLAIALGLIVHGVPLPRWVWADYLAQLQARMPDQDIQVDSVVLGLSLKPVLMVTGLQVRSHSGDAHLKLGLLRLETHLLASWRKKKWVISELAIKQFESVKSSNEDCSGLPVRCWHSLPLRLAAQTQQLIENSAGSNSLLTYPIFIQKLSVEQWVLRNKGPQESEFGLTVEELHYQSPLVLDAFNDERQQGAINAGIQVFDSAPDKKPNRMYLSLSGVPALLNQTSGDESWKFDKLLAEFSGTWFNAYPWSGNVAVGSVLFKRENASPFLKLQASELRSYVIRQDSPDDHQAAFSAAFVEGGLPAQDFQFKQAEWTYTHENAEAWTFDLNVQPRQGRAILTPAKIAGSEGLPAQAQTRTLDCKRASDYWVWLDGWFSVTGKRPTQEGAWVWCREPNTPQPLGFASGK